MRHKRTPPNPNPDSERIIILKSISCLNQLPGLLCFLPLAIRCPDKKDKPLTDKEGSVLVRKEISTDWLGKKALSP